MMRVAKQDVRAIHPNLSRCVRARNKKNKRNVGLPTPAHLAASRRYLRHQW
jgi:hypothetical protein